MRSFAKVQTEDRLVNQLQDNIGRVIDDLKAVPLNRGLLLEDVSLISGVTNIYTTLPTVLTGWVIVDINAAAAIYRVANTNAAILTLNSSAAVTVSLFVF